MGMTIDEAIKKLSQSVVVIGCEDWMEARNLALETMRKYQMFQADYEARLKADMVAMLTEIQLEIDVMSDTVVEGRTVTIKSWKGMQKKICNLIQQKINELKGVAND